MPLLITFAFIAGIVTILSPCILPILPIILSSSVGGGKQRPWGIVTGFVASFTFFTLFLTTLVRVLNISPDALRWFAVIVIFTFGLSLVIPKVQLIIEQLFAKVSNRFSSKNTGQGFGSGFLVGLSLGLLWTPCVGPILASVITLALTGSVSGAAVAITLAYAIGTAIPMLIILYTGRSLFQKIPWLLANTGKIQQAFGVLMMIVAVGIFFNVDRKFQTWVLTTFPQYGVGLTKIEDNQAVKNQLNQLGQPSGSVQQLPPKTQRGESVLLDKPAPELIPGGEWFNSEPFTLADQKGKVVLVDFWTYSCINCIRTLPYLKAWHEKYADDGLVILGAHAPEFEFEKSVQNVQTAINDFEIKYPVMQDNEFKTWRAYQNRFWPAKYLIDKDGVIRYTHYGEGKYAETEKMIQQLLQEMGNEVSVPVEQDPARSLLRTTPELYLGAGRIEYFASPEEIREGVMAEYSHPSNLPLDFFSYFGNWTVNDEQAQPTQGSALRLRFRAKEVYLVMRPKAGESGQVRVVLNNQLIQLTQAGEDVNSEGVVTVDSDRLYRLINLESASEEILELQFLDDNVEVFAFTFGS